ncbi:MAG: SGNH/GDSL hydrolase family protein [Verrucomicrobiota bacterium]
MRSVLCYGDSNTWGRNPVTHGRYDEETRWPRVAQRLLGDGYLVVEEGLVGRTTVFDDPEWEDRNGKTFLPVAVETHMPVDLMFIGLGSNDLKVQFGLDAAGIAAGMEELVKLTRGLEFPPEHLSVICPSPCRESVYTMCDGFDGAVEKSQALAGLYRDVAERHGCGFIDAGEVHAVSDTDGLHFDPSGHAAMGEAVAAHVKEVLG